MAAALGLGRRLGQGRLLPSVLVGFGRSDEVAPYEPTAILAYYPRV